jgi:putative RNA 2'-phosphotransferase
LLSYVLRHHPDAAGVTLDEHGWVAVEDLLRGLQRRGNRITRAELERVVANNNKQRFSFSDDGTRIRANQGHSVAIDLGYQPATPPATLFHGTAERALAAILREGLKRRARHHVHLSLSAAIAREVGARHGRPVVLVVDAERMRGDGHLFYVSANGVWLTDEVPPGYLRPLEEGEGE